MWRSARVRCSSQRFRRQPLKAFLKPTEASRHWRGFTFLGRSEVDERPAGNWSKPPRLRFQSFIVGMLQKTPRSRRARATFTVAFPLAEHATARAAVPGGVAEGYNRLMPHRLHRELNVHSAYALKGGKLNVRAGDPRFAPAAEIGPLGVLSTAIRSAVLCRPWQTRTVFWRKAGIQSPTTFPNWFGCEPIALQDSISKSCCRGASRESDRSPRAWIRHVVHRGRRYPSSRDAPYRMADRAKIEAHQSRTRVRR